MESLSRAWLRDFTFTFHFHALEKEMATHSSVLAWRIPGTGEPGGLPSMGSHRVGHDWSDLAAAAAVSRILVPPHPLHPQQYLVLSVFLIFKILVILAGLYLSLTVCLILLSLMINDIEHLFIFQLSIWILSFDRFKAGDWPNAL